jgi:2-keto-4-pentenoate hydratase/2-oxohepta-3-ene-1,7-dioic acid hydratase in catechol pathway
MPWQYVKHAKETGIALPKAPIIFLKPAAALTGPFPAHIPVPIFTQHSDSADYESELGVIISKDCKNVKEEEAMEYVLGYTATNDVSSRERQFGDGGGGSKLFTVIWCRI